MDPLSIGMGAITMGAGILLGHFIAKRNRFDGVEHKVEIAELGENDILALTNERSISDEMIAKMRAVIDGGLTKPGRFGMVIGDGFRITVVRRTCAPPKSPPPAFTSSSTKRTTRKSVR